jgi:hypothetical protein
MRHIVVLCAIALLSACVRGVVEERDRQDAAWSPVVNYRYENAGQYSEAKIRAADYCADRFYAGARAAPGNHSETAGEATFLCVSN